MIGRPASQTIEGPAGLLEVDEPVYGTPPMHAGDELVELLGAETLNVDAANKIIMAARAHWFADEEPAEAGEEDAIADSEQ